MPRRDCVLWLSHAEAGTLSKGLQPMEEPTLEQRKMSKKQGVVK